MTEDPWNKAVRRLINNPTSKAVFTPSPAPAVGELAGLSWNGFNVRGNQESIEEVGKAIHALSQEPERIEHARQLAARIGQLEADAKHHGNYILKLEEEAIADEARIKQLEAGLNDFAKVVDLYLDKYRGLPDVREALHRARALLKGQS